MITTRKQDCSTDRGFLYVAFELGQGKWLLAFGRELAQVPQLLP
jgi:hypothetical protein